MGERSETHRRGPPLEALMGFAFRSTHPTSWRGEVAAAQKTIDLVGIVSVWHGTGSEVARPVPPA